jgi:hypothetical protein
MKVGLDQILPKHSGQGVGLDQMLQRELGLTEMKELQKRIQTKTSYKGFAVLALRLRHLHQRDLTLTQVEEEVAVVVMWQIPGSLASEYFVSRC